MFSNITIKPSTEKIQSVGFKKLLYKGVLMGILAVEESCWQIHLLAELILLAANACSILFVHSVTIISHNIVILLLYR
jgi:hypothetical protein